MPIKERSGKSGERKGAVTPLVTLHSFRHCLLTLLPSRSVLLYLTGLRSRFTTLTSSSGPVVRREEA